MFSSKSKVIAIAVAGILAIGLPVYGFYSMRSHMDERITSLENQLVELRAHNTARVQEMASDLNFMAEKMDITKTDLDSARKLAETLKQEQAQSTQRLRNQLESNSKAMTQFREEAASRLSEVQQDATTKIGAVTGEVQTVRGDVQIVRTDLDATKVDLAASRHEMGDVRDSLSAQIAHNAGELAELRRRGERDYFEFDVRKAKTIDRVGDVRVQLKKTDTKKQKYDVVLFMDDTKIEKKDRTANEPVTFLVGRDRLRYELVVNFVDKDRIRGYISTPKDKVLSAERPTIRTQQ